MARRPLVLAHRGACRRAPENTLEAFAIARELGADGIELDVRRTADEVLVVHHDPEVDGLGLVSERAFAALREARPDVPTLAEALETCTGLLVNVEVKCLPWEPDADPSYDVARRAVDLAHDLGADIVMSSFDLDAVDAVRRHAPDIVTGFLVHGQEPAAMAGIARNRGHAWLHPDWGSVITRPGAVEACHEAGVRIDVWTVDGPDDMRALADAGVDAIITNVPDVALAALA